MAKTGRIEAFLRHWLLALLLCMAATIQAAQLDADGNGVLAPATDGTLILRHLFGYSGSTLTTGALGAGATRGAAAITAYLNEAGTALDVDGNGVPDALTDGLLIMRYLQGLTGTALTQGVIGPGATRTTPEQIAPYLVAIDLVPTLNQALLGPLAGATINAYRLGDLNSAVQGPIQADASLTNLALSGTFQLALTGIPDNEWILVTATGGQDLDATDDRVLDATPTPNQGTLHALAKASDWRAGGLKVSLLTDIFWRYTRNLAEQVSPDEVSIRLGDLLAQFFRADLTGDGVIDLRDLLHFSPANPAHRTALNFDYQGLFVPDAQGQSIVAALRAGDELTLNTLLDQWFGDELSRVAVPDSRYRSMRVTLRGTGQGRVAASGNLLLQDSALPAAQQVPVAYLAKDAAQTLVLTATPTPQSQILGWSGCDLVSADSTLCTIGLADSRDVTVSFGPVDSASLPFIDLSGEMNTVLPDSILVQVNTAYGFASLWSLFPGEIVLGSTGDGFLRRVVGVMQVDPSGFLYWLLTVDANLDEVVAVGSGGLNRALTNGDLQGYQAPATAAGKARVGAAAFTGRAGISLVPSADPADPVFRLNFGSPANSGAVIPSPPSLGLTAPPPLTVNPGVEVTLFDDGINKINVNGTMEFQMDVDFDVSYCGLGCMDHWRYIIKPTMKESLSVSISGRIEGARDVLAGSLTFGKMFFLIAGVPVWITPKVDLILGFSGKIEAEWAPGIEFSQAAEAGFVYDRVGGGSWVRNVSSDASPKWMDIALNAEIKVPYLKIEPSVMIYDMAGPSLPLQTYLKVRGQRTSKWTDDPCQGQLKISALWGLSSSFQMDLSGGTKLGQLLNMGELEKGTKFEIKAFELPLRTWYPQYPCTRFPALQVDGPGIITRIAAGTRSTLTSTVRLTNTNTGGVSLPWHVDFIADDHTKVVPNRGDLAPGASVEVLVSVDTTGFNPGVYNNPLTFKNDYDLLQPDSKTGTSERPIYIKVIGDLSNVAPVLTDASYTGPGRARVAWAFDPITSPMPIEGYRIEVSTDRGVTWTLAMKITDPALRTAEVKGLHQGLVYLRIAGYYGAATTPVSNVLGVKVLLAEANLIGTDPLNDTGITTCGDRAHNGMACPAKCEVWSQNPYRELCFPRQDAEYGRDVTDYDDIDGHAGFSFTKLDASGNPLPPNASTWSCVRDELTKLIWEVKTSDGGLRDKSWTYSWYNSNPATNGGNAGYDGGTMSSDCGVFPVRCDTEKYVAAVNAQGLCGANDWRLPNPRELMSIINNNRVNPAIDTGYFPDAVGTVSMPIVIFDKYWSSAPDSGMPNDAWYVEFGAGMLGTYIKGEGGYVRLVRGGR